MLKISNSTFPKVYEPKQQLHLNNNQSKQNTSVSNIQTGTHSNVTNQDPIAITYSEADIFSNDKNRISANNNSLTKDGPTIGKTENKEEQLKQPEVKAEIQELRLTEQNVRAHEQAHKAAGAGVTGAISYTYTTGPDGKRYISGGEVSVGTSGGSTPEETLKQLEQVKRAALAPADPSPQDLRVAASTSAQMMKVRGEIAKEANEELNKEASDTENKAVALEPQSTMDSQMTLKTENSSSLEQSSLSPSSDKIHSVRQSELDENKEQSIEKTMIERAYHQATSTYKLHMNMATQQFTQQPMFSHIA